MNRMHAAWRTDRAVVICLAGCWLTGCGAPVVDPHGRPLASGSSAALRPADARPRSAAGPPAGVMTGRVPASRLRVVDPTRRVDRYHEVQVGETLSQIARRYGTTVAALSERNGLDSAGIRPGQQLFVPGRQTLPSGRNLED